MCNSVSLKIEKSNKGKNTVKPVLTLNSFTHQLAFKGQYCFYLKTFIYW